MSLLEGALECGMREAGRFLWGEQGIFFLGDKCGFNTAPSTMLPALPKAAPILRELLKVCPNAMLPGKKLDQALLSCHEKEAWRFKPAVAKTLMMIVSLNGLFSARSVGWHHPY